MKSPLTDNPHRSILLLVGLAIAPAVTTFVVSLAAQVVAYQVYHDLSLSESLERVNAHLASISETGGWLGAAYTCFSYIANFGLLATVSVLALQRYGRRRVRCFYLVAAAVLLIFALFFPSRMHRGWFYYISIDPQGMLLDEPHWYFLLVKYPAYALPAALAMGAAVGALPLFRESAMDVVKQGNCPKCHYDLRQETAQGCPECGWNRQGPHAGREVPRMFQRRASLRKRVWLIGGWSVAVLIVLGANLTQVVSMMPRVTARTPWPLPIHIPKPTTPSRSRWTFAPSPGGLSFQEK